MKDLLARVARLYPTEWPGAFAMTRAGGFYPVTIWGERFRCDTDHRSVWDWIGSGQWEAATLRVFDRCLTAESIYYDIGAWIGPTTLYASRKAKTVYAFEPSPTAYSYLLTNLRLNEIVNAHPFHLALVAQDGLVELGSFGNVEGDSQTSVLRPRGNGGATALGLRWATWQRLTRAPQPTFVKLDVEGAEFSLVPDLHDLLTTSRPELLLSTHAPYLPESERVQQLTALQSALQMYNTCLDEQLRPVSLEELISPATQNEFRSFLFTN